MSASIPSDFVALLESTAVAFVSTIGPRGEPQTTPIWFVFEGGALRFSLVEGRQKLRNLRRDPRASVVIVDPAHPTYYLELRGEVELEPDPEYVLERAASVKYTGDWSDGESPGTMRYAGTVRVAHTTSQRGN